MIGPLSTEDVAYLAVVIGIALLTWLYRHIVKGWLNAIRRWLNEPGLTALAAHIKESQTGAEPASQRGWESLQEAINLEARQRQRDVERLEKERAGG